MSTTGNLKDTLRLPKTEMPINANLPANEPGRYAQWEQNKAYQRMSRNGEDPFILHDGPPYANGDIHLGHALNKILKDFVVKYHYFAGRAVEFIPGWDCHGLPIEQRVYARIRIGGGNMPQLREPARIRSMCRKLAAEQIVRQKEQFKTLGIVADWDNHYETMYPGFEAMVYRSMCRLAMKGLLTERMKPVYWSWAEGTALAETEIVYKERTDDAIFVAFPTLQETFPGGFLVWTTTPWTLPANVAVALHPDLEYLAVKINGWKYPLVVAKATYESLTKKGIVVGDLHYLFKGKDFDGWKLQHPIYANTPVPVVMADFVSPDTGTGCVHIAPGHGEDDYQLGLKHNLPMVMPVGPDGMYTEGKYEGQFIFDANKSVMEDLFVQGRLVGGEKVTHSYPHSERSGAPVIFRATKQWFLDLDKLREETLKAFDGVEFLPEESKNRMRPMLEGRPDWCLSRQRLWGVPIALMRVESGEVMLDQDVTSLISAIFQDKGVDCWWEEPLENFLPAHYHSVNFKEKVTDILDVWFDSGLTWNILDGRQADLYLEGNDQHRGWFQSSLWLSVALQRKAPYKKVLTHGFVVDQSGEKLAKRKGNAMSPSEIVKKHGADVLRYWVASADYTKDVAISEETLGRCVEGYRKLRNTFRFLVANLDDKAPEYTSDSELLPVDFWIMDRSQQVFDKVHRSFGEYNFWVGLHELMKYITQDLSGIYMNAVKDTLYCDLKDSHTRQSCQFVLTKILRSMLGLVAPLFTYMADEVLSYAPAWFRGEAKDVFDLVYIPLQPVKKYEFVSYLDENYWKEALEAFHAQFDKIKTEGKARDTLEVCLEFVGTKPHQHFFARAENWFVVSHVSGFVSDRPALGEFQVGPDKYRIVKSPMNKCQRCWKRMAVQDLCNRCEEVVGLHNP